MKKIRNNKITHVEMENIHPDELYKAIQDDDLEKVKELLDTGIDINIVLRNGQTPLIWASELGNYKIVEYLLNRGADIKSVAKYSVDALKKAIVYEKDINLVRLLIKSGADINSKTNRGFSPLIIAARNNKSPEILKILLEHGVDINTRSSHGITALMMTAGESNHDSSIENVKFLLDAGANVNLVDNIGKSALSYSVELSDRESSLETVKLLLEYGADPFVKAECPTEECKSILAEYRWKRLYQRDKDTARRYFLQTHIPKEIWEIILLHKRKDQLCKNLNSEKNKEILILFALEFGIPITKDMTKGKICRLISRYLVYGKEEKNLEKVEKEDDIMKAKIKDIAFKAGLDPSEDISLLLHKLSKMF